MPDGPEILPRFWMVEAQLTNQRNRLRLTLRQGLALVRSEGGLMGDSNEKLFQAREFARLSGVTVRAAPLRSARIAEAESGQLALVDAQTV
jgi:hypothetical protein